MKVSNLAVDRDLAAESDIASVTATTWRSRGIFSTRSAVALDVGLRPHNAALAQPRDLRPQILECDGRRRSVGRDNRWRYVWTLYQMSPTAYDEAGRRFVVEITTPPVHSWPNGMQISALHLDMVPGVGLEGYQASVSRMLMWGQKPCAGAIACCRGALPKKSMPTTAIRK